MPALRRVSCSSVVGGSTSQRISRDPNRSSAFSTADGNRSKRNTKRILSPGKSVTIRDNKAHPSLSIAFRSFTTMIRPGASDSFSPRASSTDIESTSSLKRATRASVLAGM